MCVWAWLVNPIVPLVRGGVDEMSAVGDTEACVLPACCNKHAPCALDGNDTQCNPNLELLQIQIKCGK